MIHTFPTHSNTSRKVHITLFIQHQTIILQLVYYQIYLKRSAQFTTINFI